MTPHVLSGVSPKSLVKLILKHSLRSVHPFFINTLFGNLNNFRGNVFHYVPKEEKKTEKEL